MSNIKNRIIKFLGGYTEEECVLKKSDISDWLRIEQNPNYNLLEIDPTKKAHMRACGVRFIENENLPSVLINLKQPDGQKLLKHKEFGTIFGDFLTSSI